MTTRSGLDSGRPVEEGMSGEHACIYYTCWYNQETKLLLTAEGGQLPPCNVLVNELAKTVSLEIETSEGLNANTIPASHLRYVKAIQKNEVLLSWYENIRAEDYAPIRWAWLTFKETEPAAVTGMVCLIQKLQIQARPDLSAILSFEGCGNILASVSVPDTETLPYDNYFFIIDKEVLVLFKSTLEKYQAAMHFYKEPGRYAIEQVLSRKDIGQCEIKTPSCHLIFKLESVGANILLESIRKCRPLPKQMFTDDVALREYLAEVQVQHHMAAANAKQMQKRSARPVSIPHPAQYAPPVSTESDMDSAVSLSNEYHFEHVINTLDVGYNAISDDDQLTVMWAATEADIKDVVTKGLVPGSSIGSSGMDPNSYEHFAKCIDEIQDALFEESYGKAVSHLRGTKKLFSECRFPFVKSFLKDQSDLDILKKIYFRDKQ